MICNTLQNTLEANERIAIYGLTTLLINSITGLIESDFETLNISCDVVDSRPYTSTVPNPKLRYVEANWVNWSPDVKYRAVVGDDVITNLGVWQIPLFFRALHNAMLPGGRFITCTTAMYSPDTMHPSWRESLNKLRWFDPLHSSHIPGLGLADLTEGVVYEIAWPTLHSDEFYDARCRCFDFGSWDRQLAYEQNSTDFKSKLRLQYKHRVTSLDYGELKRLAQPFFRVVDELPVYSVWDSTERLGLVPDAELVASKFREYYRILVFERI